MADPRYTSALIEVELDALGWRQLVADLRPGAIVLAVGNDATGLALRRAGVILRDTILIVGQRLTVTTVLVGRLPLAGSLTEHLAAHGTGAINVEAARVRTGDHLVRPAVHRTTNSTFGTRLGAGVQIEPGGRWPGNVILRHQDAVDALDDQSGVTRSVGKRGPGGEAPTTTAGIYGAYASRSTVGHEDIGGCSRFFRLAQTSEELRAYLTRLIEVPGGRVLVVGAEDSTYGRRVDFRDGPH